jgi:hypothetical protein
MSPGHVLREDRCGDKRQGGDAAKAGRNAAGAADCRFMADSPFYDDCKNKKSSTRHVNGNGRCDATRGVRPESCAFARNIGVFEMETGRPQQD